jgi:hypothetical protein
MEKALALVPQGGAPLLSRTVAEYRSSLRPLAELEPQLNGDGARSIANEFAPIGAKMRPDMSQEQAGFWASALIKAWADLPPSCLKPALQEAVRIPFDFPTHLEARVRQLAEQRLHDHHTAILRLQAMLDAIQRAASPQPALEGQSAEPMSLDEIRRTPAHLRAMGIRLGMIDPQLLAQVEAEEA